MIGFILLLGLITICGAVIGFIGSIMISKKNRAAYVKHYKKVTGK